MKQYKIYKKVENEKIVCVCLRENKRCKRFCEKDIMLYDQYQHLKECFENRKEP